MHGIPLGRTINERQPINWSAPLNQGLSNWLYAMPTAPSTSGWGRNVVRDLNQMANGKVNGTFTAGSGGAVLSWTPFNGWDSPGSDTAGVSPYLSADMPLSSTATATVSCVFIARSVANYRGLTFSRSPGTIGLILSGASGFPLTYMWEGSADEYLGATGLTVPTDVPCLGVLSVTPTAATVYLGNLRTGVISSWTNTKTHNTKSTTTWQIGRDNSNGGHVGTMNSVRLWPTRALTAADVQNLFDAHRRGYPNELNWVSRSERMLNSVAGGAFKSAWTRNANTVISMGAGRA